MPLTSGETRQYYWVSSFLSPLCLGSLLLSWLLSPQGAEADTEQGQWCRQQQIAVSYSDCRACLVSTLWTSQSKWGHVRAILPLLLTQRRFSAITYFTSSQSRSCLWKTWCLFWFLQKCELWEFIILLAHQWNYFSLSSVTLCSGSRHENMRVKKILNYVSTETKSSIWKISVALDFFFPSHNFCPK